MFKPQTAVLHLAELIIKIFVNSSRIDNLVSILQEIFLLLQKIRLQPDFNTIKQPIYQLVIPSLGDSLPRIIEIIIVKSKSKWQPPDNKCRKLTAITPPLLLRISLHKFLIYVPSDK
jgi:hypothetical protein